MKATIHSIALANPLTTRTNQYFMDNAPKVYHDSEKKALARLFQPTGSDLESRLFDEASSPYLNDPFKGTESRYVLGDNETSQTLEITALKRALDAAKMSIDDIDLIISVAFRPDEVVPGNASFIAMSLGSNAAVMNLEATCSGTFMALQTARSLVEMGLFHNVAITISCTYSRDLDLSDSLCWFLGDGAGAIVVGATCNNNDTHFLGTSIRPTTESWGAFQHRACGVGEYKLVMGAHNEGPRMRVVMAKNLKSTAKQALKDSALTIGDVDFVVVNTPTAWIADFAMRVLELPRNKTLSCYQEYGNVGPALTVINLWKAFKNRHIEDGSIILLHAFGTVSNAGSALLRIGRNTMFAETV